MKVFISYSSKDQPTADVLATCLEENNVEHFLDRNDIQWGDDINNSIIDGIKKSTDIIVVISSYSLKSQWVPYEVGIALGLEKRICPLLLDLDTSTIPGYLQHLKCKKNLSDIEDYVKSRLEEEKKPTIRKMV